MKVTVNTQYGELLLHSEAPWLSRGRVLKRFKDIISAIVQFFKQRDEPISELGSARLTEQHFPELVPRKEGKKTATRRCRVCSQTKAGTKKRKESSYMCRECDIVLHRSKANQNACVHFIFSKAVYKLSDLGSLEAI
ncbi:unnamed protein product [Acanthoscelides obtectus]|uniref:Transposase n=1 Tax=Acanthoscelides obtectus TaxID=200917 RepID=A0A9P0MFS9_ACAOB|nr:unnamed protein product [Acanthoscelides obtectus]CAK1640482.1 PiggyBac transposable element-derived protein 4 [Acanthoscelides obtectus]